MRMWSVCVAGIAVLLAGCGGALSVHPLSDEKDSVLDERLIGVWEPVPAERDAQKAQQRIYVGRLADSDQYLEGIIIDFDDETRLEVKRFHIRATRLGGSGADSCLSLADEKEQVWLLVRYRFDAEGRMFLQSLSEERVVQAIRAQEIAGHVKEHPKEKEKSLLDLDTGRYAEVRLSASTKDLRAWLEKAPATWEQANENRPMRKLRID